MDFNEKTLIKDNYYWSAKYHSFDQRHGDIYYVMTIHEKTNDEMKAIKRFGVRFSEYMKGDRSEYVFLFEELSKLATLEDTNIPSSILWKGIGQDHIDQL